MKYEDLVAAYKRTADREAIILRLTAEDLEVFYKNNSEFLAKVDDLDYDMTFLQAFEEDLVPDTPGAPHTMYTHKGFKASCISPKYEKEYQKKIIERAARDIREAQGFLESAIRETESFSQALLSIPHVSVQIIDGAKKTVQRGTYPNFQFANVTKRTPEKKVCNFISVDIETTGLESTKNEIIQISAVLFEAFTPVRAWVSYIKPRKGINLEAYEINGITEADVEHAPYIEQVMQDFEDFLGSALPLVGHNLEFDLEFLYKAGCTALENRRCYDTYPLSQKVYQSAKYKLDFLCRKDLKLFRNTAHDALSDCVAAGILFKDICSHIIDQT